MKLKPETDNIKALSVKLHTLNKEYMALPKDSDKATDLKAQVKRVLDKLRSLEGEIGHSTAGGGNYTTEVTNIEDLTGNDAMGFASKAMAVAPQLTTPKKRGRPSKK